MKKKVFSLMMTFVLAFMGIAQAQVSLPYSYGFETTMADEGWSTVYTANTPATSTTYANSGSYSFRFSSYSSASSYDQYLISPELNAPEGVTVQFYYRAHNYGTEKFKVGYSTTNNQTSSFTFGDEVSTTARDWTQSEEYTFPAGTKYVAIYYYSNYQYYLYIDDFTFTSPGGGGGGGGDVADQLHVKYMVGDEEVIDELNLGVRPIGSWMEPFDFTMYTEGATYTVNVLDFTPSDGLFTVSGEDLPFQVVRNQDVALNMTTNGTEAGVINRQFVAITEGDRAAHIWPVTVELYAPEIPDVWEKAYDFGNIANGFSYQGIPSQITPTQLHNDYTLPFPEISEGVDAVYKFTVTRDMILNAHVDEAAADGKVALYKEGFEGEGGPMATNNYLGLGGGSNGGGAAGGSFEAMIGDEASTSTTNNVPMNYLYNYSLSTQLYLGTELVAAGVTTSPMSSISWYSESTYGYNIQNISIWMANVSDTEANATSPLGSGMTLVYQGNFQEVVGWNEFVFNAGSFAWDGQSNVLVMTQMNNGDWSSAIYWKYHNAGFDASSYARNDYDIYDAANTAYSMTTTTSRANTIFKSNGRTDTPDPNASTSTDNEVSFGPVISNLGLTPGTYYLVASANQADYTVYINANTMPCPAIDAEGFAFNPQPADNEDGVEPGVVTLRWMVPEYATGWRLVFGSTYYPDANHPQTVMYPADGSFTRDMANSYTVTNLWNNTNYFWRVEFNNDGCPDGVSSPVWGFTTHLNVPQNLTVDDETVFNDETITLHWNSVVDRTYRKYFIYRDGVKIGETEVNNPSATTYTDGPLAYNMVGYTYYVTAIYDEGESAPSNEVVVKVSGYGNVSGHVYEQDGTTGIANATVTMAGQDEFGDSHTYNFTTDASGYYIGTTYAGSYNGSAACNGYQSIDEPVQGNPIAITYGNTTNPVDYVLDENFYTPCSVVAEYYPDSLDVNSPYVKVYWGCGLPGTLFEPFETGDFSQYDWQLDPTYPWTITTNNPYEGTYCMKSGGAGVANVTSNMTVSINIPDNGEMSFFGKISCESNYDKGHFYIDGMEMATYTGSGSWGERTFPITAGTHVFQWRYTKDSSVNSYDDCFYVDNITFYRRPAPASPGWHTYCEAEFDNAYRSNVGDCSWGYDYPASLMAQYAGFQMTKVSVFSDNLYGAVGGNFTCNVYVGGNTPGTGTLASSITVDVPNNVGDWVEYDLAPAVNISGTEPVWVIWHVNTATGYNGGYPAGCSTGSNSHGDWWNNGQDGWDHQSGVIWTMKNYLTNRSGRTVELTNNTVTSPVNISSNLRTLVKGQEDHTAECINSNPVVVPMTSVNTNNRAFSHYRVYRTNCYNDGPYTEDNTVVLACELLDTLYIDVSWPDVAPGVYKWGVGCVYVGNRGEEVESQIAWSEPVMVDPEKANRDETYDFENGQIPAGWTNDATYPWTVVNTAPQPGFNGSYCIMSGNGGVANSTSSISTTVNYDQAGTVSFLGGFWGEGSSDTYDWDKCRFYIDGNIMIDYGAHQAWQNVSFPVTTGNHTFTWTYKKDGSVNPTGDAFFVDDVTFAGGNGGGGGNSGGGYGPGTEPIQEPRESEIVWSNCLDKNMYMENISVTVLLNSADSPEGTLVDFTNLNAYEQENYPVAQLTLDETGHYVFDSFRRGDYAIRVQHEGYEPIFDTVSIWESVTLRYVMIEILYGVRDIYVSRTGWAMWEDVEGDGPIGGSSMIDFETGDFSQYEFNNSVSNYPWIVTNSNAYEGTYCMKSTNNGVASSTSAIEASVNYSTDGTVSFAALCMGEGNNTYFDHSDFYIDGDRMLYCGANVSGWNEYSYPVTAGNHTFRWAYTKDSSVNPTGDAMFVDNIVFEGGRLRDDERHFEFYKVMCTSIDGVPIYNHNTVHPFCQLSYDDPYNAPLVPGDHYLCKVASVYSTGMSAWSEPVEWVYQSCEDWGPVDEVTVNTSGQGNHIEWVFEHGFNPYGDDTPGPGPQPGDNATVILTAGNVWSDGSGYQMLLDADANAYGTTIPETGALSMNCSGNEAIYAQFEYKIPTNADGNCSTQNIVINNSVSIQIPAGTYDWCITNPTPGDRIWIAAGNGNVGGRQNDYVFEAGRTYEFTVSMFGGNDGVDVVISGGTKNMYAPLPAGEVKDIANVTPIKGGENGTIRPYKMLGDNLEFNLNSILNYNERVYFLYNLYNDSHFNVVNAETAGRFLVSASESYIDLDLEEAFNDFCTENAANYSMMDKVQAAQKAAELKPALPSEFMQSLFTYDYVRSRENDACNVADPACSDSTFFFPAPVGSQTAESGPDYDCLYTQPRPVWYYFQIDNPGAIEIYMYSNPQIDIDFCCWGPFDDPVTPCPYGLTGDKVVDCSYSTSWNETCNIPATAQTGEYYIMVITNYNGGSTNITFSQVGGTGTTNCEIVYPTADIIGFLITQDGEYLDIVGPNVREYTDIDEFGDHEYCVRPIYPGEMVLPDHNYGWSMGCPVCNESNGQITCDAYMPIHGEAINATDQVKIWWGEENPGPGPEPGEPFTDDFESGDLSNWTLVDSDNDGENWETGTPASYGIGNAHSGTYCATSWSWNSYTYVPGPDNWMISPEVVGATSVSYYVATNTGYPDHYAIMASSTGTNISDFTMVFEEDAPIAKGGAANAVKSSIAGGGHREMSPWTERTIQLPAGTKYVAFRHYNSYDMNYLFIDDVTISTGAKSRANIEGFKVYRSTDNVNYDYIYTVQYVDGQTYYEYIDTPSGAGTYYYQVTTIYDNECESEPAVDAENLNNNYVEVGVTGINENSDKVALYPNPTKGNVTIEANGMSRITVVSMLGQVVFDAEINVDNYTLNMAQFDAGMYMVRVYTEEGVTVKRVTVMQ